jgi:hypothetical protein
MAFTPDDSSLFSTPPPSAEGAWISTSLQEKFDTPCPWIIEIFADGSVESNYINDDLGKLCMFARVPYEHEPDHDPALLRIAGQLSTCLYKLEHEGAQLLLACEDKGVPSADDARWIAFDRLDVEHGRRLRDLAGKWLPPLFWGGKERMVIEPDGQLSFGKMTGKVEIVRRGKLLIEGGAHDERCLFKVTANRLTLRCVPAEEDWPPSLFDPEVDSEKLKTMVFYRLSK